MPAVPEPSQPTTAPTDAVSAPSLALPVGGGAIRGMGEKFAANPVTGTGSATIPVATSPGRAGLGPQLTLSYDSGAGNGPFGFGWHLDVPSITRKTEQGLPRYADATESDVFLLSGADDLVPSADPDTTRSVGASRYRVRRYRPRVEGLFALIERWSNVDDPADVHWRSISSDNVLTLYGVDAASRISDPVAPMRVFAWLISETRDDKGNAVGYGYVAEDAAAVDLAQAHERNRGNADDPRRTANRYLKRIRYANRVPLLAGDGSRPPLLDPAQRDAAGWMFEVVLDYDEGHVGTPTTDADGQTFVDADVEPARPWSGRSDPFSSYRAGFEVRTYRLCRRVLLFHHFAAEDGVGEGCLTRSTELTYRSDQDPAGYTFLSAATQAGYRRDGSRYLVRTMPPVEFGYSQPVLTDALAEADPDSLRNLPVGLGTGYQWIDLHGEGVPGVLAQEIGAWFYKRNLSPARDGTVAFAPLERVAATPGAPTGGRFLDLYGDGQPDLVVLDGPLAGLNEHDGAEGWHPFRPFTARLTRRSDDPQLRFVDLDGDGRTDALITEQDGFVWHGSLAEAGFGPARRVPRAPDEERGPRLVFAAPGQAVLLADCSGDGLTDLVRVRNGEVCYWPNLGYGRFGAKVTMDGAPLFDHVDAFDSRRIRLADIDGTGTADMIYLHRDGARLYMNRSGNGWSEPRPITAFPPVDDVASVDVIDLRGTGTACLVWSSPLPGAGQRQLRYVDLMGQKPHLLVRMVNNLGAETEVRYAASTTFYLRDKAAGQPWITRLPYPVHVVERVQTDDRVSGNRFVTRYAYHHGYFDGVEREFRGFGMVEQWDTEESTLDATESTVDPAGSVPPALTRSWFHTGAYPGQRISDCYAGLLEDTVLPPGLTPDEEREACRALKGALLRQETYALDGSGREANPYLVSEQNFGLLLVQPRGGNRHAVFLPHPRERLRVYSERDPADPRTTHELTLRVDGYGNVLRAATIGYGRQEPDPALSPADRERQAATLVTVADNGYTNAVDLADCHRTPMPAETRGYELTGLPPAGTGRYRFEDVDAAVDRATQIPYEQPADPALVQKRLFDHVRTRYRPDDLGADAGDGTGDPDALLPANVLESLALAGETYRLAFTPGLLDGVYGTKLASAVLGAEGGYVDLDGDGNWWVPAGRVFLSPRAGDSPPRELAAARAGFFTPRRYRDPFGQKTTVTMDGYDLLAVRTSDPLGNTVEAVNDYRMLRPRALTDANGNRSEVASDALGLVVGTAIGGKTGEDRGDTLAGFVADLTDSAVLAHLADPLHDPWSLLQGATTRLVVDPYAYLRGQGEPQPMVTATLQRETHRSDLPPTGVTPIQHQFCYWDGFGREIQRKVRAEDGPDGKPRWVGNGWTVYGNKGQPVRRFEPFFSATHRFTADVRQGVSSIVRYDPIGRAVATLNPDHTWQKTAFTAWRQESWDAGDTALIADPATDPDVGGVIAGLPAAAYLPTWYTGRAAGELGPHEQAAATQAAVHAGTPTVAHVDPLGRTFLSVTHNRLARSGQPPVDTFQCTRTLLDIEGNPRAVVDALDRTVVRYDHDVLGRQIHADSLDSGERWILADAASGPIRGWDSRGNAFRTGYDALRRPVQRFVSGPEFSGPGFAAEVLFQRIGYGEGQPGDRELNLRGRVREVRDGAGVVTSDGYDFKGNPVASTRRLTVDPEGVPDWATTVDLEPTGYTGTTSYDALNRPVTATSPDGSVLRPAYNEAGLLDRVDVNLRGELAGGSPLWTSIVTGVDYDAKRRRTAIRYANGATTAYDYDPLTFRLTRLRTVHGPDRVQDLAYTYDPVGNITHVEDGAQQTVFFRNRRVEPSSDYGYDATYRLVDVTAREHLGQNGAVPPTDAFDAARTGLPQPGDGTALGRYRESYAYDAVGNLLETVHTGGHPANPGWTRGYTYAGPGNRLTSTQVGAGPVEAYQHDAHGNMTALPHLSAIEWTLLDELRASSRQVVTDGTAETTYYTYDADGRRVRKVTRRQSGSRRCERIYLGGFEVYREFAGDGEAVALARETLHVTDDKQRVAMVETRTAGDDGSPPRLISYQFANQLGSASLELDETGRVISYEEFYVYGGTSYQAVDAGIRAAAKRYRYAGMERDEETGLNYHGARYYAPWLGRWISPDPAGLADGVNLYVYCRDNPTTRVDPNGKLSGAAAARLAQIGSRVILTAIGTDAATPEPTDAVPQKWGAEAVVGAAAGLILAGAAAYLYFSGASSPDTGVDEGVDIDQDRDPDTPLEYDADVYFEADTDPKVEVIPPGEPYPPWANEEQRRLIDSGAASWSHESGWNGPMSQAAVGGRSDVVVTGFAGGPVPDLPRIAGMPWSAATLDATGALFVLAQIVHDPSGTSYPMRIGASNGQRITAGADISQRTVAIGEVRLADGSTAYYASASEARLTPQQVAMLENAGIPRANIFTGAAFRVADPLLNHAEQVILRHMPPGSTVVRWGISWAAGMRGAPCQNCARNGVDARLVETQEMADQFLSL